MASRSPGLISRSTTATNHSTGIARIPNDNIVSAATKVLHLTDPHLFARADGALRGVVTAESLRHVLDHYNAGDWRAECALITGDLIQDDSEAAYQRFRSMLEPLAMPLHCIPGNHDVRALMQEGLSDAPFTYCAATPAENWLLVGADSCITGHAGGEIAGHELARVEALIADTDRDHVLVYLHHPPVPMHSAWLDSVSMSNGPEVLSRFRALAKVRVLLFGHVHQPYDAMHDSIRVIGTPSTCRQFKPGSDVFAVDETPPAYRRLQLNIDGSVATDLVWL